MDSEQRGIEAQRVLDSPIVKEVLQDLKQEIIDQWAACPARDAEGREWLWRHYVIAQKFEGILMGYAQSGRFEQQAVPMIRRLARKIVG